MNSTRIEGVEPPTPSEAEARRRYLQGELDSVKPSEFDGKVKVKFTGEGESKHLNITADQYEAIKKIIVPEPESPVSFSPCLQGKVLIDGAESEFMVPFDNDSVKYSQWGADNTILWPRVDLMDALADAAREWWIDNRPDEDSAEDDDVVDALIEQGLVEEAKPEGHAYVESGSGFCGRCDDMPGEGNHA